MGVVDNVPVDPNITVCHTGVVKLDVEDSCELVACTVRLHIGGHCSGGYFLASSIELDRDYCQDKYNMFIRV